MVSETFFPKILIISSCSGEKKFIPENSAIAKDLDDLVSRDKKENELRNYITKAREMFISSQNKMIYEGLSYLDKSVYNPDLYFVSSGYGYISSEDEIIPYDINLSAMSMVELDKRSEFLKVHEELYYSAKNYDIVIFLLGYEYLRFIKLPIDLPEKIKQIFFVSSSDEKFLPSEKDFFLVRTGNEEASKFNVAASELKGHIFKIICQAAKNEDVFSEIYKSPEYINKIISEQLKLNTIPKVDQLNLFDL